MLTGLVAASALADGPNLGPPRPTAVEITPTQAKAAAPVVSADGLPAKAPGAPMSVLECIEEALVNSPDIAASRAAIQAARGSKMQARAALLPPVDFTYTEIFQKESKATIGGGATITTAKPNYRTFRVGTNWVIFSGGAMQANMAIAKMSEVAAMHRDETTINTVVGNTVLAYLQLLRAQELKVVADRTVDLAAEQVKVASASFEAGAVPKVNVLRAQSALAGARQSQLQADNGIEVARSTLLSLMGRHVNEPLAIVAAPRVLFDPPDLGESLKLAVTQRPELKAQQASIKINEAAVKAARAGFWPNVAVNSNYTHTMNTGTFGSSDNWQVALALNLNVFDWGGTKGDVMKNAAQVTAERNKLERQMRDVELDVRKVLLTMGESRNRVEQAKTEVDSAAEALRIEQLRFAEGEGIYLELLDARRALSSAETNLVTAYFDNALAQAGWLGVTGSYLRGNEMNLPGGVKVPFPTLPSRPGKDLDQLTKDYDALASAGQPAGK